MRIRGVRTPVLRSIAGDPARRLREEPQTAVELAPGLVESGGYDERTLAYLLLSRHRAALASLHADHVEALGAGIDNWGSVDAYCTPVAGPAWLAGQLGDEVIDPLVPVHRPLVAPRLARLDRRAQQEARGQHG